YSHGTGNHDLLFGLHYGENDVDGGNFRHRAGRPTGLTTALDHGAATTELFAMDRWRLGTRTTLILAAQAVSAERDVRTVDAATGAARNPRQRYRRINPRIGAV